MTKVKGVILSVEDVILPKGKADPAIFTEVSKLINYFRHKGIEFAVFTNRYWYIGSAKTPLEDKLKERWGDFPYFCRETDRSIPAKPKATATKYVIDKMGWDSQETLYIGASENDMRTAVNGNLLFLRATWWADKTEYGFEFDSPRDIARYIDIFCLRDHLWCHEIHDGDLNFYALAPFSTFKPEYTLYSADARAAAKHGMGHPDFWIGALVSSLYFSGIHSQINHIATYPGHRAGAGNPIMDEAVAIFGKCFRKSYLSDLVIRHTDAPKSQKARNAGEMIGHLNQLNSIHLNEAPLKTDGSRYKTPPLGRGKTILVIDDICTKGYSLESARKYIEATGAKVISVSWLKTINTDIESLGDVGRFNPYQPNNLSAAPVSKTYSYHRNIVDHLAPGELTAQFSRYANWDWP
ncbi:phosphoribosyl transferase [Billgrantia diversa]|uniref:phosphoribosyl transferase n=1 Tax=Halomonas sp. MCCC 1A13316 TaxID=2733487 RepID=UPI0018A5210E|nr:phosphoribosyl transferase [Halomonas sp. MCCC 1A13316]QOR40235.1 phosphoribosyl transferase [Halomonas sp. MCCC 1A13316]